MNSEDIQMISTGALRLPEGTEVEPGETVYVEKFELSMTPRAMDALGITPDMSEDEVAQVLRRAMEGLL